MKPVLWLCLLAVLLFYGCGEDVSSNKTYQLCGAVVLENGPTVEQVQVELYQIASPSEILEQFQQSYPNCGAPFSQDWLFDHRLQQPIKTTFADDEGFFRFDGILAGQYMLTLKHSDYGYRNVGPITVDRENIDLDSIDFLAEVYPGPMISQYTVWEGNRHYIIENSVTVNVVAKLDIKPGATVIFSGENTNITVAGRLTAIGTPSDWICFTSSSDNPAESDWDKLYFINSLDCESLLSYCVINYANNGIAVNNTKEIKISNSVINNTYLGISINTDSPAKIDNCTILSSKTGIKGFCSAQIERNIILECVKGIFISNNDADYTLLDNIIAECDTALLENFTGLNLEYNYFNDNQIGLWMQAGWPDGEMIVQNNNFEDNQFRAIHCYFNSYPVIQYNNFSGSEFFIYTKGQIQGYDYMQEGDIDAQHNYWGTTNLDTIRSKIRDGNTPGINDWWLGEVDFDPFEYSPVTSTGPR